MAQKALLIPGIRFYVTNPGIPATTPGMAKNAGNTLPPELVTAESAILQRYWRGNLYLMGILMVLWALVSLGCGVLWADWLNQWELPGTGYPLGFWFAQQGSIIAFVLLILVYAILMNRLDKVHHEEREALHLNTDREEGTFRADGI